MAEATTDLLNGNRLRKFFTHLLYPVNLGVIFRCILFSD
ncbi:hypothetical protein PPEP_a4320 [Pseudoalteromonas peptidolytica F12-50-A1]|uniref:Uncharacterized protein n=1 Tax=Pseudoalteromonas peptidolytica F12-50-A1 TaxID=1315280 RepID=A0A8I0MZE8_9GAMM|nr:hypothetical protein [Pseudoalteromonas peptidolytica F12-50-A1]